MIARASFIALAAVALFVGCGKNSSGSDANPNVADANPNAPDANPNAPDANPNAPDAGMTADAGLGVTCGQMYCAPGNDCCIQQGGGATCVTSGTCAGTTIACDGKEDCTTAGDVCCFQQTGGSMCQPAAGCGNPTCVSASDCPQSSPMCCTVSSVKVCLAQCF